MAECGVCYELYEKEGDNCPKLLPCGHSLCLSCLRKMSKPGYTQCPFCRMTLQILCGDAENFPTNEYVLTQNKIYTIPPLTGAPEMDCNGTGICQLHGKQYVQVAVGDTKYRVCESCLNPEFFVLTVPEAAQHAETQDDNQADVEGMASAREWLSHFRAIDGNRNLDRNRPRSFIDVCKTTFLYLFYSICGLAMIFTILVLPLVYVSGAKWS